MKKYKERVKPLYCVYDFESGDSNPNTCDPLQLAAEVLDPRSLEVVDGGIFSSYMKPTRIVNQGDALNDTNIKDTALNVNDIKRDRIHTFPDESIVWNQFVDFCCRYAESNNRFHKIIPVTFNGVSFDHVIVQRLIERHKTKNPFHEYLFIDMAIEWFTWTESFPGGMKSYGFDYLRSHTGLIGNETAGKAHDARRDVSDLTTVFRRFMLYKRRLAKGKNWFKDIFIK